MLFFFDIYIKDFDRDMSASSPFVPNNWNPYLYHHIDSLQSSTLLLFQIFGSTILRYMKFFISIPLLIYNALLTLVNRRFMREQVLHKYRLRMHAFSFYSPIISPHFVHRDIETCTFFTKKDPDGYVMRFRAKHFKYVIFPMFHIVFIRLSE